MEISVAEAAERLGVDPSRVQRLLRAGSLPGRRLGRTWAVDAVAVARLAHAPHRAGRPMAPARAWALLDLLDGGAADWLTPVARSQVRTQLRRLTGAEAGRWRDVLRARSEVRSVRVHPAALRRIAGQPGSALLPAGAQLAAAAGADLVVIEPVAEYYLPNSEWLSFVQRWRPRESAEPNLLLRLPRGSWPFTARAQVGAAVLAADLLDANEPRSVRAGLELLTARAEAVRGP